MYRYRSVNEDEGDLDRLHEFIRGDGAHPLRKPHWEPMPAAYRVAGGAVIATVGLAAVMYFLIHFRVL